jgi:hypothetical protein
MPKLTGGRSSFRDWVDGKPDPKWPLMTLTHITKGVGAEDISKGGVVKPTASEILDEPPDRKGKIHLRV